MSEGELKAKAPDLQNQLQRLDSGLSRLDETIASLYMSVNKLRAMNEEIAPPAKQELVDRPGLVGDLTYLVDKLRLLNEKLEIISKNFNDII